LHSGFTNTKEGESWSAGGEREQFNLLFPEGMYVLVDNFHFSSLFLLGKHSLSTLFDTWRGRNRLHAFKGRNRNAGGELNRETKRSVGHNQRSGQFVNVTFVLTLEMSAS